METVIFGRRRSDQVVGTLVESALRSLPRLSDIPVEKLLSEPAFKRNPRRSKAQLRDALKRALILVKAEKPHWSADQVRRRARNMVRLRQVV
jgi:hypothetical protein